MTLNVLHSDLFRGFPPTGCKLSAISSLTVPEDLGFGAPNLSTKLVWALQVA